jgi:hypothetical protein
MFRKSIIELARDAGKNRHRCILITQPHVLLPSLPQTNQEISNLAKPFLHSITCKDRLDRAALQHAVKKQKGHKGWRE